jgi:hypothetical protein
LNASEAKKLQVSEWLISAILVEFNHLRQGNAGKGLGAAICWPSFEGEIPGAASNKKKQLTAFDRCQPLSPL